MPRGEAVAPDAERHLTPFNILRDFSLNRARVVKGLPAWRVFTKDPRCIPTLDFPWYEHPRLFGSKDEKDEPVYSIIVDNALEPMLKRRKGELVAGPAQKGMDSTFKLDFEYERVYIDMYLTAHEEAAFRLNDATNPNNILRSAHKPISMRDDNNENIVYRDGIRDMIVNYSYTTDAIDTGIRSMDAWPSGPNRGKSLNELSEDFLKRAVQLGSSPVAGTKSRELAEVAQLELERRMQAEIDAENAADEDEEKVETKKVTTAKGGAKK